MTPPGLFGSLGPSLLAFTLHRPWSIGVNLSLNFTMHRRSPCRIHHLHITSQEQRHTQLCCQSLITQRERTSLGSSTCHVEIDNCEPIVVYLDTIWNSSPLALEDGGLQIASIVDLYDIFYEPVVVILVPCEVKGFSANAAVLALAPHVLLFGVKRPPIDVVLLPRCN